MNANSDQFPERLKLVVGEESERSFSRRAGISNSMLRQCLAGSSEPTRPTLIALAAAGNVNVAWLATGEGPMRPDGANEHFQVNESPSAYAAVSVEVDNPRDRAPSKAPAETDLERRLTPRQRAFLGYLDGLTETQQQEVMRELQETKRLNDELFEELLTKKGRG